MELVLNVGASENNILIIITDFPNYDSATFKRVFTHCMPMNFVQLLFSEWEHISFCDVWGFMSNSFAGASRVGFDD